MQVKDLIRHFSAWENVPIDVEEDILPVVKDATGIQFYFWQADIETSILRGQMTHWSYEADGQTHNVIDIDYPKKLSNQFARLVCCKELIHALDPIDCRVMTELAHQKLVEKIVLPPEMQEVTDGDAVWTDRVAVVHALAVLFPWACRELLNPAYEAGKIDIEAIAELVELPAAYAAVVMSDDWGKVHHSLII